MLPYNGLNILQGMSSGMNGKAGWRTLQQRQELTSSEPDSEPDGFVIHFAKHFSFVFYSHVNIARIEKEGIILNSRS